MIMSSAQMSGKNAVLIVNLSKSFGGVDVRVFDMAQWMHGRYPYTVAVLAGSHLHQRLVDAGLNVLALRGPRSNPRLLFSLLKAIRSGEYTVVDAHNPQSQFWGLLAATLCRVPGRVSSVHTAYGITPGGLKGWFYTQVLRLNALWGCTYMTVSRSIEAYLQSLGVPRSRIALIYNGIQLEANPVSNRAAVRQAFGWDDSTFVVSVVGRLERQKGHDFILEALPQVVQTHPQLHLLIVGDGRLRDTLEQQAQSLGVMDHVTFTGFREDIHDLLSASDAFCLPSRAEGLPFALLEASTHGLPLLLSDVDGMGELFTHLDTAYLFPPGDIPALAEGLQWLMNQPLEAIATGERAHAFVQSRLSPKTMIAETVALYERASTSTGS
jgi:glycosyltransferase involved in cell wall biosynthesis